MTYETDTVGGRIAFAMDQAGFRKQTDFALAIGKGRQLLNSWINGHKNPDDDSLALISRETGYPVAWLRYGGDTPDASRGTDRSGDEEAARDVLADPRLLRRLVLEVEPEHRLTREAMIGAIEGAYRARGAAVPAWLVNLRREALPPG